MDLKLSVLLGMIDKVTAPLRSITGASAKLSKELRDTRQRLKDLGRAQADVRGFRDLKGASTKLAAELDKAKNKTTELGQKLAATTNPTRRQTREFEAAKRAAASLGRDCQENAVKLQQMRSKLSAAGISTKNLAAEERRLRDAIAGTNTQLGQQQAKMQQVSEAQRRSSVARQAFDKSQSTAAHMAVGGYAAMETGHHLIAAIDPTLDAAKAFQNQVAQLRAQGVGDQAVTDAVKFARGMDIMGASATDNLKLLREANSVLRDMHEAEEVTPYLARMKYGIETVMAQNGHGDGHGENAETMFMDLLKVAELRGAAKNPESLKRVLDFATQAYVASGGLVKPEDLLNMIKTGGIAAKQLDNQTFFFGLLHTMQEMGGHRAGTGLATAYQNWAAGRTTQQSAEELMNLGLLDKDSVKYGSTGHVKKLLPDALKEGDLYRTNPFEYLMTRVVPKINPDGKLSDQQVVSKINALFSGRKGGDLFASMFIERANIAKHVAAAPKAYGVDALYAEGAGTAAGQEVELRARRDDLYRELGTQLLPLYVAGLTHLVSILKSVTAWSERNPRLAKGIVVLGGSMGVLLTAAGGLMIGIGGLVGQFSLLRYALRLGGIRIGLGAITGGGLLSRLPTLLPSIGVAARAAMAALAGISVPLLLLVAAFVAAALVVRKYWQPIAAWFEGVGQGIAQAVGPVLAQIADALAPLKPAWDLVAEGIATVWRWITQLLEPMQATKEQLDGARENGVAFGQALGAVLGGVLQAASFGVRMFVALGEAIGNAAGWAVTHWQPVADWFGGLWDGIKQAAAVALDWINEKLDAVRSVIDQLAAAWRRLHGDTAPALGTGSIDWITGSEGDQARARRIADALARTPVSGGDGNGVVGSPAPIAAAGKPVQVAGDTVQIHIDARGQNPADTTDSVRQALQQHERDKAARARSAYSDED